MADVDGRGTALSFFDSLTTRVEETMNWFTVVASATQIVAAFCLWLMIDHYKITRSTRINNLEPACLIKMSVTLIAVAAISAFVLRNIDPITWFLLAGIGTYLETTLYHTGRIHHWI